MKLALSLSLMRWSFNKIIYYPLKLSHISKCVNFTFFSCNYEINNFIFIMLPLKRMRNILLLMLKFFMWLYLQLLLKLLFVISWEWIVILTSSMVPSIFTRGGSGQENIASWVLFDFRPIFSFFASGKHQKAL